MSINLFIGSGAGMSRQNPDEATQLLQSWRAGDSVNLQRLAALVYNDLHRIADGAAETWPEMRASECLETRRKSGRR
jgi:hypothetical protein